MPNFYEPLSFERHEKLRWSPPQNFEFTRDQVLIPLTFGEIHQAAQYFPLCLRRIGAAVDVVAILADALGRNTHLDAIGNWTGGYIPFFFRAYPFSLVIRAQDGQSRLAITHDQDLIGPSGSYPLFNGNGTLSHATSVIYESILSAHACQSELIRSCELILNINITSDIPSGVLGPIRNRQKLYFIDREKINNFYKGDKEFINKIYEKVPFSLHLAEVIIFSQRAFSLRPVSKSNEVFEGAFSRGGVLCTTAGNVDAIDELESYEKLIDFDNSIEFD